MINIKFRKFGPKKTDQDEDGKIRACEACGKPFKKGDFTTLVSLGPGDDPEAQENCRMGRVYNAVAIEIHWICATGELT
jgi:hypothetical protein